MNTQPFTIRFASSWSTQFRLTQALGKGLSELANVRATVSVGERADPSMLEGEVDLVIAKSVVNEHRYTGKGLYAGPAPATWLRTIAWLPQEDRFLFAVAPLTGITSFEDVAAKKPALKVAGRAAEPVLKAYGFTYKDIESWGGTATPMEHTAKAAKARYEAGQLDALFGDGSAYDGTCWKWIADRGYRFLGLSEPVMQALEKDGLRRNITPAGLFPGISENLLALDDSHIVLTCHERMPEDLAYLLAKVVDERKREIERQWDQRIVGAPLHAGAERYYRERGVL